MYFVPSVFSHCFVGHQEEHLACKKLVMRCWCGYLSGVRCRFFCMVQLMPLHPNTPSSLTSFQSRLVLPFWYLLIQVVLEKRPLSGCCSSCCCCCCRCRCRVVVVVLVVVVTTVHIYATFQFSPALPYIFVISHWWLELAVVYQASFADVCVYLSVCLFCHAHISNTTYQNFKRNFLRMLPVVVAHGSPPVTMRCISSCRQVMVRHRLH